MSSQTVGLRGARQFFICKGGDVSQWTTDQAVVIFRRVVRRDKPFSHKEVCAMKKVLAFLLAAGRKAMRRPEYTFHDDSLRANQGARTPAFSFWRALVS
jgi:hypothetical protein